MNTVHLLPFEQSHAPTLHELVRRNREPLAKFAWVSSMRNLSDSHDFIRDAGAEEAYGRAVTRLVIGDARPVGVAGIHSIDPKDKTAALGYWLDQQETGKGYATAAVRRLADMAFGDLDLEVLMIAASLDNRASCQVAERAGFVSVRIDNMPTWDTTELTTVAHYELTASTAFP